MIENVDMEVDGFRVVGTYWCEGCISKFNLKKVEKDGVEVELREDDEFQLCVDTLYLYEHGRRVESDN